MSVKSEMCGLIFTQQKNLNRHKNVHKATSILSNNFETFINKCLDGCNCSFKYLKELREHLKISHNYEIIQEIHTFETFQDFNVWLNDINKDYNSQYSPKKKATNEAEGSTTSYYYCNRSGIYLPKRAEKARKRKLKMQGSCKLNRSCTSSITVKEENKGKCTVTYYKTHYKHKIELQHLRILKQDIINIAHKLSSGVTVTRVLDNNRRDINSTNLSRKDLLTRKDINNVIHSFKMDIINGVQHENDSISADMWVEEYKRSSFVYYKRQGEDHDILDNKDVCF